MSTKFPGGFITKSPVAPTSTAASGIWTLDQQQQAQKAGTWPSPPMFIEDLFSTWLIKPPADFTNYSINNGIDLLGKGGMTWFKARDAAQNNIVYDTVRGSSSGNANALITNSTSAQQTTFWDFVTPNSNGFTVNFASGGGQLTNGGINYVSWTFREQPKFFDVVTYTGNGANRTIAHNLGSVPGCIIVKRTNTTSNWQVYHRSLANTQYTVLNDTASAATGATRWNSTTPTDTVFSLGTDATVNASGSTYVAYLFAHNAGGFPASGTGSENGISCGSFTHTVGTNTTVNLGYEPQWLLVKAATGTPTSGSWNWFMVDTMRGFDVNTSSNNNWLFANSSNAETQDTAFQLTNQGFTALGSQNSSSTYIYIAIRRGPMKTPTTGTSVFTPYQVPASPTTGAITGFVTDAGFIGQRAGADKFAWGARLMGNPTLNSTNTNAESANTNQIWDRMNGWWNTAINNYMTWGFARAPGFFDVVCYTGTGGARTLAHNLGVVPELMLVKQRTASPVGTPFAVYSATMGNTGIMFLNSDGGNQGPDTQWNSTTPTASVFSVGSSLEVNQSGSTYVAYLFASCPGVSRVGSYTGTGTTQVINCGFTAGSRFVMIKRVGTGDWFVWDTARGMIPANDPYLLLNSTAAETTGTDFVDTTNVGFEITSTAPAAINANGGTFIFLAIA